MALTPLLLSKAIAIISLLDIQMWDYQLEILDLIIKILVLGNSTIDLELLPRLWDKGFTPVYTEKLIGLLNVYSKRDDAEILKNGFLNGFLLNYIGPRVHLECTNLLSTLQHRYETLDKLQHEVELGRMLGPFSNLPISNLRISPIGLVAKPDGGLRLITNCSAPEGNSVNSYI